MKAIADRMTAGIRIAGAAIRRQRTRRLLSGAKASAVKAIAGRATGARAEAVGQANRARRIDVRMNGVLWTADGGRFDVMVLDISAHGFRIEVDEPLAVGERVRLAIDAKDVAEAEIKWVMGREAGGTFAGQVPAVA